MAARWELFHPSGARSAIHHGMFSHRPFVRDVLSEFNYEVEGVEHMKVFLEILRIRGVKEHPSLEWFKSDLLQRNWRPSNVFGQVLLGELIQDAYTVVDTKSRMPPREKISGKLCIEEFPFNQEFDHPASENFYHRLEAGKRDMGKCALVIKASL
ncbi:MAG: hypothetical protein P1P77_16755 [Spirochaetaceae bacterium]|nr:hypothetical protein [Spirochaetaceae bacterium]